MQSENFRKVGFFVFFNHVTLEETFISEGHLDFSSKKYRKFDKVVAIYGTLNVQDVVVRMEANIL